MYKNLRDETYEESDIAEVGVHDQGLSNQPENDPSE
jgi:hypothetical protein